LDFSISGLADPLKCIPLFAALITIPRQIWGASTTHVFCNRQGRIILKNDGYEREARLFNQFGDVLDKGVVWADKGWRSTSHHYNPDTGRGIWPWASSAQTCAAYYSKAFSFWQGGNYNKAMFMIGAAAHLVQDACVPHHASCIICNGHQAYENWVEKRKLQFKVQSAGIYDHGDTPQDWIIENARLAKKYYSRLRSFNDYQQVTAVLLPIAQRSTAGFFKFCARQLLLQPAEIREACELFLTGAPAG